MWEENSLKTKQNQKSNNNPNESFKFRKKKFKIFIYINFVVVAYVFDDDYYCFNIQFANFCAHIN